MPRKARLRRRGTGWSAEQLAVLAGEPDLFDVFASPSDAQDAWNEHRNELLSEHIRKHPGTRPEFWWRFEMPAGSRRERTDGEDHPFDSSGYDLPHELRSGIPRFWRQQDLETLPGANSMNIRRVFETEAQFLSRLSLLTGDEQMALVMEIEE